MHTCSLASSEAGRVESILRLVLNRVERLGWVRGRTPVQVGVLRARRCGASTEVEQTDKMQLTRAFARSQRNTSNEQRDLAVRASYSRLKAPCEKLIFIQLIPVTL